MGLKNDISKNEMEAGAITIVEGDNLKNERLFAFWDYDVAPYLIGGEVLEIMENGLVKVKGFTGMRFRPRIILPYEKGLLYKKLLIESEKDYMKKVKEARNECLSFKTALLKFHTDPGKIVRRAYVSSIRSGNTFLVNGKEHVAAEDAHYNSDEDTWIVYDTDGESFFEEDVVYTLEEKA